MGNYSKGEHGGKNSAHFRTLDEIQEAQKNNPRLQVSKQEMRNALKLEVELLELNIKYYTYQMQLSEVVNKFQNWQKSIMEAIQKEREQAEKVGRAENPVTPEEAIPHKEGIGKKVQMNPVVDEPSDEK